MIAHASDRSRCTLNNVDAAFWYRIWRTSL
jgi:hypothetical protein